MLIQCYANFFWQCIQQATHPPVSSYLVNSLSVRNWAQEAKKRQKNDLIYLVSVAVASIPGKNMAYTHDPLGIS